jgi:hypothetical protein
MEDFNIKGYLKINKYLSQLDEVTSKEKARLQQLFQKALNDPDLDGETLNKIKNAVVSKNLKSQTSDGDKNRGDVLDKYAGKFNLPRTIQKYIDGSSQAPQYKFQFAKLLKDPKNLITKGKLESKVEGSLLDLVSPSLKNNPLFKEVTDYLLTFRARGKGVGEAWLLTFGNNPDMTPTGDVGIDGYDIEVKDGSGLFSVDSKLGRDNKYIHDKLNDDFFIAFDTKGSDFQKLGKERNKKSKDLSKIRNQIKSIKQYLDKGGRKPISRSIPSDEDIKKYSNLDPKQVDKLRETLKKAKQYISEAKSTQGYGLDYTKPVINKFLLTQKKTNPELLKKELDKYYKTLYKGASINVDELTKYIYDNVGNGDKIVKAMSTFILKQYFNKEGFDVLMIVDPENFKYRILTQNFISGLSYGDDLPGDLTYEPKFKRGGDSQNLADGWVNMGFK